MKRYRTLSLRTLMILVLLICIGIAAYPRDAIRLYERQSRAVALLNSTNLKLEHRNPRDSFRTSYLRLFISSKDLKQVVAVNGRSRNVKDEDLQALNDLPWLEKLYLANTRISDQGLAHLEQCHELKRVSLWSTNVTDEGLAVFADKQKLEVFDISNPKASYSRSSRATRNCLEHFSGLSRLKVFKFSFPIEESDLSLLEAMPRFAPDALRVDNVTDTGIYRLTQWRSLENLSFTNAQFVSLAPLQWLPRLKSLSIGGDKIEDEHLAGLTTIHQLESLSLWHTSTTHRPIPGLLELPNLRHLSTNTWNGVPNRLAGGIPCDIKRALEMSKSVAQRIRHKCYLSGDQLKLLAESPLAEADYLVITDLSNTETVPAGVKQQVDPECFDNDSVGDFIAKSKNRSLSIVSESIDLGCTSRLNPDSPVHDIELIRKWRHREPLVTSTMPNVKHIDASTSSMFLRYATRESSGDLKSITLRFPYDNKRVSDIGMLEHFPNLEELRISRCFKGSYRVLRTLTKLESFEMYGSEIDYEGFRWLAELPNLRFIRCDLNESDPMCKFNDPLPFPVLEELKLLSCTANTNLFSRIGAISSLKKLELDFSADARLEFDGAGLDQLEGLEQLTVFRITDKAIANIGKIKSLRRLKLPGYKMPKLSDESLRCIASLPNLERLDARDAWTDKQLSRYFNNDEHGFRAIPKTGQSPKNQK